MTIAAAPVISEPTKIKEDLDKRSIAYEWHLDPVTQGTTPVVCLSVSYDKRSKHYEANVYTV